MVNEPAFWAFLAQRNLWQCFNMNTVKIIKDKSLKRPLAHKNEGEPVILGQIHKKKMSDTWLVKI